MNEVVLSYIYCMNGAKVIQAKWFSVRFYQMNFKTT